MCIMACLEREEMRSKESGNCDGIFEGSVIVHLVRNNVVVNSGIRDGVFLFVKCLVHF